MKRIKATKDIGQESTVMAFLARPYAMLLLFFPLTICEALPSLGGKNPFYYAAFFLLGYLISAYDILQKSIGRLKHFSLICVVPLSVAMIGLWQIWSPSGYSPAAILVALMRNLCVLLVLIVLLGYGEQYLNKGSKALDYLNQAALPVYILHQTLMMAIAYNVVQTNMPTLFKFTVILFITLAASFAGYEVLKRFKVTRFLFGVKS